jgi:hypothetical protein
MRAPWPRDTNRGVPPTLFQARTGLFTPPGITRLASAKRRSDRFMVREFLPQTRPRHQSHSTGRTSSQAKIFLEMIARRVYTGSSRSGGCEESAVGQATNIGGGRVVKGIARGSGSPTIKNLLRRTGSHVSVDCFVDGAAKAWSSRDFSRFPPLWIRSGEALLRENRSSKCSEL